VSESRLRLLAWVGLGLVCVLYLGRIGGFVLQDPDEGRYAEIPREMVEVGDWTTPHLNYVKYFEKPPLLYWLIALSYETFGTSEWSARLISALAALATLVIVYRLGLALFGRRAALLAAGVLATSPLFFVLSQVVLIDGLLTTCFTATMAALLMAHRAEDKARWCGVVAVAAALGVLAKGPVALVLPGAIGLAFLLWERDFATLRALLRPAPIATFAVLAVPWFVLVSIRNPEFPYLFFVREHLERFATDQVGHPEGPFYFVPVMLWALLPWTLLVVVLATRSEGRAAAREIAGDARRFLVFWAVGVFAFFSSSSSKLPPYIMPAIPPLALLAGAWIDRALAETSAIGRAIRSVAWVLAALGVALAVAGAIGLLGGALIAPRFDVELLDVRAVSLAALWAGIAAAGSGAIVLRGYLGSAAAWPALVVLILGFGATLYGTIGARSVAKTSRDLAAAIARETAAGDDHLVVSYRRLMQSLSFYTRGRVTMLDPHEGFSEIASGVKSAEDYDDWFWSDVERLRAQWASGRKVFVATDRRMLGDLSGTLVPEPRILARDGRRVLVVNFPPASGAGRAATVVPGAKD
jgi:4-amino-4-deoxy-L-arabinose transferase-like glycosyltransferase